MRRFIGVLGLVLVFFFAVGMAAPKAADAACAWYDAPCKAKAAAAAAKKKAAAAAAAARKKAAEAAALANQAKAAWNGILSKLAQGTNDYAALWATGSRIQNVHIMGPTATCAANCLTSTIQGYAHAERLMASRGVPAEMARAFGRGFVDSLNTWASQVKVPALGWYPGFAAWPGPMAPPTPNIPMPLMSLPSVQERAMFVGAVEAAIRRHWPNRGKHLFAENAIRAYAAWVQGSLPRFKAATMVMNVLGKGPVPSFAPPAVPVGPVVNGSVIPGVGHLRPSAPFGPVQSIAALWRTYGK